MIDRSLHTFESAGRAVLALLRKRLGFDLWLLTRTEGPDWIVLQAEDHGYGVVPGDVIPWADTFCAAMVKGKGPRVAPDSDTVPAYASASLGKQFPIKAYIGVPLTRADGALFGTLCAIDPSRQPDTLVGEQELLELFAAMLSSILALELKSLEQVRSSERLELESKQDALTKLANRRAWDQVLRVEEERCRRYGHPAAVLAIDLDELKSVNDTEGHAAGDLLIVRTAEALRVAAREPDTVARLGGDEFGILAIECDQAGVEVLVARVKRALVERGVKASIGAAVRVPLTGLQGACETADRLMYEAKRKR